MNRFNLVLLAVLFFGCTSPGRGPAASGPESQFAALAEGGREGLHGMVLYGAGPYYLEHIPMLTKPHDFQIIAQVELTDTDGQPVTQDFSQRGFSLKPAAQFSLNDYVSGRLRDFSGSIHDGSFELGGPVLPGMQAIQVRVVEYKVIRQLPADAKSTVFKVADGHNTFESNAIRPSMSIQKIRNVTADRQLWCVTGPDFFEPCR